jgi:HEAT repeat protein
VSDPQTARAAVEALAVLSTNLLASGRSFDNAAGVTLAVVAASRSDDLPLRSAAAFTLGVLGGPAAVERLAELAGDSADDVRFNAALGLARQGREESLETLAEMLALPDVADVAEGAGDTVDAAAQSRRYKRALVVVNALRGLALLVDGTNEPPPRQVLDRVEQLKQDPVGDVRSSAEALLKKVERLTRPAA